MSDKSYDEVSNAARKRYGDRLKAHGASIKALGWDTSENQRVRFDRASRLFAEGGSVLDLGCGFGDLFGFLAAAGRAPSAYRGVDLMPEFVEEARRRHGGAGASFSVGDIMSGANIEPADTVVALGLLNFRLASEKANYDYIAVFLERALAAARRRVVFDGISVHRAPGYAEEPAIFYADPARVIELVGRLSPRFELIHTLPPIPQREYLVAVEVVG